MTRELAQKRPVSDHLDCHSSTPAIGSGGISVPPKKRPRRPELDSDGSTDSRCDQLPAPLDLSAAARCPGLVVPPASLPGGPSLFGGPDGPSSWQAAAAAAMYAQYLAYLTSFAVPPQPPFLPPLPPPPPPLLKASPPPPPPRGAPSKGVAGGETDFLCSCGHAYASLFGLTLHLKSAGRGHSAAAPAPAATDPRPVVAKEQPKLVRGQDMWINSETEQTREILRCMRCGQSYASLPDLTMHMMRSRHYAEIIYSSTSEGVKAASDNSPGRRRRPSSGSSSVAHRRPSQPLPPPAAATVPAAYLSPNLPLTRVSVSSGGVIIDSSPLSCLQRLVNSTAALSAGDSLTIASSASAAVASPSAASFASTSSSSTSEATSVVGEARSSPPSSAASATAPSPPPRSQPLQPVAPKKARCQHCGKPFANKGQVRLHVSKGKCPAAAAAAGGGLCYPRRGASFILAASGGLFARGSSAAAGTEAWQLPPA